MPKVKTTDLHKLWKVTSVLIGGENARYYIPVHSILKMRQYILLVIVFLSSVRVMVFSVDISLAQQNLDITKGNSTVWAWWREDRNTKYKIRRLRGP